MNRLNHTFSMNWALGIALTGLMVTLSGCGHSLDPSPDLSASSQYATPVDGVGGFGSQCAYGELGDPIPMRLTENGCALQTTQDSSQAAFHLSKPLLPIILQADCKKMEVTARTINGYRIEDRWNALPDGRFYFVMNAGDASLGSNGAGDSNCDTTATVEVTGLMKCRDRDHAQVEVDAVWHLGQSVPGTEPNLTGTACRPIKNCDLHGFVTLNQCGG